MPEVGRPECSVSFVHGGAAGYATHHLMAWMTEVSLRITPFFLNPVFCLLKLDSRTASGVSREGPVRDSVKSIRVGKVDDSQLVNTTS